MRTLRSWIAVVAAAAGVSLSGAAQGSLIFDYAFTNSGETVGPTDVVVMHALLTNDPISTEHLFGSSFDFVAMFSGTFAPAYSFASGLGPVSLAGIDLAPGQSAAFDFGHFTPDPGPVAPGLYSIMSSGLGFTSALSGNQSATNNSFNVTVAQQVPEPGSLVLVALALTCVGLSRRRLN